jgi:succinyl-CoA synthetase beta subunit/citryl-CoA synthetase large subunit
MARVLEHSSKVLLKRAGVPVPEGAAAATAGEAAAAAEKIGLPVVVKALVPAGKRGKAGAVRFADTSAEVASLTTAMLGTTVGHYPVEQVLVEGKLDIAREMYLSITIDRIKRVPVIIAGRMGGMDVEELAERHPDALSFTQVDPVAGLPGFVAVEIWSDLGLKENLLRQAAAITSRAYQLFVKYDATILELNPLAVTRDDQVVAAAAVLSIDESSLYRQPELQGVCQPGSERAWRPLTALERHLVAVNEQEAYRGTARYTELDGGDIGFMCGGGGASLLLMDALIKAGGRPANYSEIGGNPTESKVYGLCKGVLAKPGVRGLFLAHNITSNTQISVVATGVVRALRELNIAPASFPVVVREAGTFDAEGKRIFEEFGIEYHGDDITLTEAAQLMVERMRRVYPDYDGQGVLQWRS